MYTTGSFIPRKKAITFLFHENEAISAHTCDRILYFPKKAFVRTEESYQLFSTALLAVMGEKYNLV